MLWSFPPSGGYDFGSHWRYVTRLASEGRLPFLDGANLAASHPPLFYALAAGIVRLGGDAGAVQVISVLAGVARLGLLWIGLELVLGSAPLARRSALALAALLPAAVHVDGMVNGESLCATLVAAALCLVPAVFRDGRGALALGAALGAVLGLGFLAKISAMVVALALAGVGGLRVVLERGRARDRVRRALPVLAALATFAITVSPWIAWNEGAYGKAIVTTFDASGLPFMPATETVPVLLRRPPEFYLGWTTAVFASPYYPTASLGTPRFFPQLVASTFVDYYNNSFAPAREGVPAITVNDRPLPLRALALGRVSMAAGTVIAALTAVAWAAGIAVAWSARAWAVLAILAVPLASVGALAEYALVYPHDWLGVVKGAYVLHGATPLFGCFGLAVAWLARRHRALALVPLLALAAVAAYTLWCRTA